MKSTVTIKAVLSTPEVNVISVPGAAGDTLEKHKVSESAILLVKQGSITYKESGQEIVLANGDGHAIPAQVYHEVHCHEQAEIFLVVPKRAKMKFEK